jgi:hypothetical protein
MAELSALDRLNALSKAAPVEDMPLEDRRLYAAQRMAAAGMQPTSSFLKDVVGRGVIGQGLAMGAGDEAEAYARSLIFGTPYEQELAKVRSEIAIAGVERPKQMAIGEFAGALAPAAAATLLSGGAAAPVAAARTAGLAAQIARGVGTGAAVGAGTGGVEGFLKGEGGAGARLDKAAEGAMMGGLFGGALGGAFPAAAGAYKAATAAPEMLAAERATSLLAKDQMTPDQLMQAYLARQTTGVKPEIPAEVMARGGNVMSQTRLLAQSPGATRGQIGEFLEQRTLGQQERLGADIEAALGGQQKNIFTSLDDLAATRMQQAAPLYQKVDPLSAASAQMDDLLKKVPSNVFSELEAVAQIKGTSPAPIIGMTDKGGKTIARDYTYAEIDSIQKALDDQVSSLYRLGKNNQAKVYQDLRDEIIGIAEKNPDYRQARAIWADTKAAERAMAEGQNIFKQRAEITERKLKNMTQADKDSYLVGVFDAFQNVMLGKAVDRDVTSSFRTGNAKMRMEAAIKGVTDDPVAAQAITDRLFTNIEREAKMAKTKNVLTGGSQTAPMQLEQQSYLAALSPMAGFARDVATGNAPNALSRMVSGIGEKISKGGTQARVEQTNAELSKLLFAKSAPELKAALDAIRDQMAKKGQYGTPSVAQQLVPGLLGGALGSR